MFVPISVRWIFRELCQVVGRFSTVKFVKVQRHMVQPAHDLLSVLDVGSFCCIILGFSVLFLFSCFYVFNLSKKNYDLLLVRINSTN